MLTRTSLAQRLRSAGWSVCVDARRSQSTGDALDYYWSAGSFPGYLDVVGMATGSNDIFDPTAMPTQVARARSYAGRRPVLRVTIWARRTTGPATLRAHDLRNSARVNAVERRRVTQAPPTAVIDWFAFLQAKASRPAREST